MNNKLVKIFIGILMIVVALFIVRAAVYIPSYFSLRNNDREFYIEEFQKNKTHFDIVVDAFEDFVKPNIEQKQYIRIVKITWLDIVGRSRPDESFESGFSVLAPQNFKISKLGDECLENIRFILNYPKWKRPYWRGVHFHKNGVVFFGNARLESRQSWGIAYWDDGILPDNWDDYTIEAIEGNWYFMHKP